VPELEIGGPVCVDVFILVIDEKLANDFSCFIIELLLGTTEFFKLTVDYTCVSALECR